MAPGNVTVKAGATVLGVLTLSGYIPGVPETFPLDLNILYKYANLTLPYSPNDPGLKYTFDNSANTPHVTLAARFFNLLNEPSTGVTVDVGSAAASGTTTAPIDCLNVLDFGAVGDGKTNDTAAIQCALDQAARNWTAQQQALAQGITLTNPGSTIVCIPSGYTFMVGGQFWQTTCGRAWATNGNWPVIPYDVAKANLSQWTTFNGKLSYDNGAALYVHSGVTVQLDGIVKLLPIINAFNLETGVFCIFDERVASFQASDVTIRGTGVIDCGGGTVGSGGLFISGIGIMVAISANFTLEGVTVQNSIHWAVQLFNNPVWPAGPPFNSPGTFTNPTVYSDSQPSNINILGVTFVDCSLFQVGSLNVAGCMYLVGTQMGVDSCTFERCGRYVIYFNGKQVDISNSLFDNCCATNTNLFGTGNVISIGQIDSCSILGNQIKNGGQFVVGATPYIAIHMVGNRTPLKLLPGVVVAPNYPIDYTYNVKILGNLISNWGGDGFTTDTVENPAATGFFSAVTVTQNTFAFCWTLGLTWKPSIWPHVGSAIGSCPQGLYPDGLNYAIELGGNTYNGNGQGVVRNITTPNWPVSLDLNIGDQKFSVNAYANQSAGIMGSADQTCAGGGSSAFIGPYNIFPYPNVSTSGTSFVERAPQKGPPLVATLINGVPSYIPADSVIGEVPSGSFDGTNKVYSLSHSPAYNVLLMQTSTNNLMSGASVPVNVTSSRILAATEYGVAGNQITMQTAPSFGSNVVAFYRYSTISGFVFNTVN